MSLRPRIYPRPAQEASAHHQRLGRLNHEIKRRRNVARIFPGEEACLRLVTALAVEPSEEWVTGQGLPGYGASRGDGGLSLIHISEPTRLRRISYAVFCLKKKKKKTEKIYT